MYYIKRALLFSVILVQQAQHVNSNRSKRSTCHAKFNSIPNHSACLPASSSASNSGVSSDEASTIVEDHNKFRSQVTPTASGMMKMSWDDEIAMVAQKYADACKVNIHDGGRQRSIPGRLSVGQNLAAASSDIGWAAVVQLWHSEVKDFNTGGGNSLSVVGHYTQVVWADSIKIGCGYAQCGSMRNYVCNYGPAGNFDIDNPYTRGASCSECQNHCDDKLCDCNGLVCQNGGTLDKSTCTCTCKNPPLYFGARCDLNCSVTDPNNCRLYQQSDCDTYSNVPQDCPTKCNVCPYAGVSFVDPSQTTSESPTDDSSMKTSNSSFTNTKSSYSTSTNTKETVSSSYSTKVTNTKETVSSNYSTSATITSSTLLNTVTDADGTGTTTTPGDSSTTVLPSMIVFIAVTIAILYSQLIM